MYTRAGALWYTTMGCLFCKSEKDVEDDTQKPKEYSWDKRERVDPKEFIISDINDEDICRLPGSVGGQQIVVQNCSNAMIYVLDHINSINIDDCTKCKIILGPIKGSLFVRDCSDCVVVVACGQFRLRDCHHLNIFLHCATQPIIESSTHIRFTCLRMNYNNFREHMAAASLSVYNNLWSNVHDFTPVDGGSNWCKLPASAQLQNFVTPPFPSELLSCGWSITGDPCVIPFSCGLPDSYESEMCLVLLFAGSEKSACELAELLLSTLLTNNSHCILLTSREVQLQSGDIDAMQLHSNWKNHLEEGPVVGLIFGGNGCLELCLCVAKKHLPENCLYVSPDLHTSKLQISSFLQCASMHLGC